MSNNIIRGKKGREAKLNSKKEQKIQVPKTEMVVVSNLPKQIMTFEKRDKARIGKAMIQLQQMVNGEVLTDNYTVNKNGILKVGEKPLEVEIIPKETSIEYQQDTRKEAQNKYFQGSVEVNTSIYSQEAFDLGGNQGGIRFHIFNSAGEFPAKKH